tara:strand:+ start:74 stop:640 length:567 start_codon:yes stop_codon:yes gene_type:complete
MRKRWLIAILVVIAAGLYLVFNSQGNFNSHYATLQNIENSYQVGEELLVPGELSELNQFEEELQTFRNSTGSGMLFLGSMDAQAVNLLVDARLELIEMERDILAVRQKTTENGFPDCTSGGNVQVAVQILEQAADHAQNAGEFRNNFSVSYPALEISSGNRSIVFQESVDAQLESIDFLRSIVENACT